MYDANQRLYRIKEKLAESCRRRKKRIVLVLSCLCLSVSGILICIIVNTVAPSQSVVIGMYASILLQENAGSYVLVGVISFTAAVLITALCVRYRENMKNKEKTEDKDKP